MIVIIIIHKLLAKLSIYSKWFGAKLKGEKVVLCTDSAFVKKNRTRPNITENHILKDLRLEVQSDSLEAIQEVYGANRGDQFC